VVHRARVKGRDGGEAAPLEGAAGDDGGEEEEANAAEEEFEVGGEEGAGGLGFLFWF